MYERRRSSWLVPYLVGYGLGTIVQLTLFVTNHSDDITPQEVKQVQVNNNQIQSELESNFEDVSGLSLTVDGQEFEFQAGDRSCEGQYEVNNEVATVVGDVACTQVTPIG